MNHQESLPIIGQMMRDYLQVPEGTNLQFTERDFMDAVNALSAEDYMAKREAITAFHFNTPPGDGQETESLRDNE
jgi:hypothetical protein